MLFKEVLQFIIFLVFGSSALSISAQKNAATTIFWNSDTPGVLLQNLDSLTTRAFQLPHSVSIKNVQSNGHNNEGSSRVIQKRADYVDSYENKSNEQKIIPYDYDKAYDEFVKKYFSDAISKYSHIDDDNKNKRDDENEHNNDYNQLLNTAEYDDNDHVAEDAINESNFHYNHDDYEEHEAREPISEASRKHTKKKKCKSVKRHRQKCLVCKNSRTGENSESCEYNKRKSPKNYAYKKEKNYSKYNGHPEYTEDNEEFDESDDNDGSKSTSLKSVITSPTGTTKCTATTINNKVCYQCENEVGEQMYKCYAATTQNVKGVKNKPDRKFHQRIHKRTVSYSVENTPINSDTKQKIENNYKHQLALIEQS